MPGFAVILPHSVLDSTPDMVLADFCHAGGTLGNNFARRRSDLPFSFAVRIHAGHALLAAKPEGSILRSKDKRKFVPEIQLRRIIRERAELPAVIQFEPVTQGAGFFGWNLQNQPSILEDSERFQMCFRTASYCFETMLSGIELEKPVVQAQDDGSSGQREKHQRGLAVGGCTFRISIRLPLAVQGTVNSI